MASRSPSRSQTPSRAVTPCPQTPSRLVIAPSLRPTHSLSNLHVHMSGPSPGGATSSHTGEESSASSVINVDMGEGILVPEADAEVGLADAEAGNVYVIAASVPAGDEASKRALRDHLRRTLNKRDSSTADVYPPRQYFILTDAGKPVFTRHLIIHESDDLASIVGIMQALISVFLDDGDKIRCINAGNTRISILLRPPLYYACASSWGEPESVTRSHLEYLHLQVLSVVTVAQLRRIFERRTNFDLGRLLGGSEVLVHSLLERAENDMAMGTSSLHCLKLDSVVRSRAANHLVPTSKMKDLLYLVLVARGRVITLARPKKHSIHPADLHILLNTAHSPSIVNSSASASWLPLCLPKYNPSAFVHVFVTFLQSDAQSEPAGAPSPEHRTKSRIYPSGDTPHSIPAPEVDGTKPESSLLDRGGSSGADIGLLCVSANGDFESIRAWCGVVIERLENDGTLANIEMAIRNGLTEYCVADLSIPGLRHFIYKSRSHVQITSPIFEEPYDDVKERRRLIILYQTLYDGIHAKSGQNLPLKLQYIRTEKEAVMGWITQPFEMYIAVSQGLPKSAAISAANAVARWVKKEEGRLFLRDAPIF
ncbi:trafficking protein Mon1-domain-containing protein [Russula earlei]|uniref:Trafficking protein Mon1-domain-containing protein n=1 Tax=Russula earlei TaxID=71964 RepID=A0ACC0ULE1_9AGAM|nr:trafficking protein Mon1-domain-containing protein [Russula earlei]